MLPFIRAYSLMDYYATSVITGLLSLPGRFPREAAARVVNPLSYPRYREYQLTFGQLGSLDDRRVLDIGSPKLPILLHARHARCELVSTDIRDYFIAPTAHFLRRLGHAHRLGRDIHLKVEDARSLSFGDESFDRVYSISVIEHIPDDGDSQAMRQIARVLRPGGVVSLTVPFQASGYYEEYVRGDVYERQAEAGGTFYQRRYDLAALEARLIAPSGLQLQDLALFGEPGLKFEKYWNRITMRWKLPLLWLQPFVAELFLRILKPNQQQSAVGVALKLAKPLAQR